MIRRKDEATATYRAEPTACCLQCRWLTRHNRLTCQHDPPPKQLGILKVVDWHGWCEFFEAKEETNDASPN